MPTRSFRVMIGIITLATLTAGLSIAGPLDPPLGPVASTGRTVQEIFDKAAAAEPRTAISMANTPGDADSVFRITSPGSYYLTGHVFGSVNRMGIEIASANVTIDLSGFSVFGAPGSLDGIATSTAVGQVVIRNGFVTGCGGDGIDISTNGAPGSSVIQVGASGNAGAGISVGGGSLVQHCVSYQNTGSGFMLGAGSVISHCSAYFNSTSGVVATNGATITSITAYQNTTVGISAGSGSTVIGCTARFNGTDGFLASQGTTIKDCTATSNGFVGDGAGIHITSSDCRVEGNTCTFGDRGIDVDAGGNFIVRNICSNNAPNWDIAAGNVCIVVSAATTAAFSGASGGTAPGSTDPNANFSY